MNYHVKEKKIIKAKEQVVWGTLMRYYDTYYSPIAHKKNGVEIDINPSSITDFSTVIWEKESGQLELERCRNAHISRNLERVTYIINPIGEYTQVTIDLELCGPGLSAIEYLKIRSLLKPIVDDNLIWLKTAVEDQIELAYRENIFARLDVDKSFNWVKSIAQEAKYLSLFNY